MYVFFDRKTKKSATKTAASAATGIRVDRKAEIEDEVPVWVLDPAFEEDWRLEFSVKFLE